jgi:hypothetical protein
LILGALFVPVAIVFGGLPAIVAGLCFALSMRTFIRRGRRPVLLLRVTVGAGIGLLLSFAIAPILVAKSGGAEASSNLAWFALCVTTGIVMTSLFPEGWLIRRLGDGRSERC